MIRIKSDKIIVGESLFDGYVYALNGKIVEISKEEKAAAECYDFTGKYVSAGFIDLHTHGAGGHPFINGTVEDVIAGCNYHLAHGTTTILPTISAGPFENMKKAVENLTLKPDVVLVDAIKSLDVNVPIRGIIKGDMLSYSIGCASILAKVERDNLMVELSKEYPEYGFEKHKGYGTKAHIEVLKEYGPCVYHRLSFLKFLDN